MLKKNRWFRFYPEAMRHPKIVELSDREFRMWIRLLCVACENDGFIPPLASLKRVLSVRLDHLLAFAKRLASCGLIDELEDGFKMHNWEKYQYKSDSSTERVKHFREKRNVSETFHETPPETETETEAEKEIKRESVKANKQIAEKPLFLTATEDTFRSEILETFEKMHVRHRRVIPIFTREITEKAKQLARTYTVPKVLDAVRYFFEQDQNSFVTSRDYSFGIFFSQVSRIMQELEGVAKSGQEKSIGEQYLEECRKLKQSTGKSNA